MELEAVALEALHGDCFAIDGGLFFGTDGETKNGQPAILLPELTNAPVNTLIGLAEAALGGVGRLCWLKRDGHQTGDDKCNHTNVHIHLLRNE